MSSRGHGSDHGGGGADRTFVTELQPNDILMGRGAPISDNHGNRRFLSLIRENCLIYQQAATRKEKDKIARQIVSTIRARNGLFLRKIDTPEEATDLGVPPDVEAWTTADEKAVLLKIKQALRDRGLEAKGQARSSSDPSAQQGDDAAGANDAAAAAAGEVLSSDDDELGADEMVAHGMIRSSYDSSQLGPPRAKRAKQTPAAAAAAADMTTIMPPAPTQAIPAVASRIIPFQGEGGALERSLLMQQNPPNFPFLANFSSQGFNQGGGGGGGALMSQQPSLQLVAYGQQLQNWNRSCVAGLNLSPANSMNLNLQLDGGKLQAGFRASTATFGSPTNFGGGGGGELKMGDTDHKLPGAASSAKTGPPPNSETVGDIALRMACEVCEKGQNPSAGSGVVTLDPIELCLLSVLISRGLPTWSSTQFLNGEITATSNSSSNTTSSSSQSCPFTWNDVGLHLVQEVQRFVSRMTSKLFPHDTPGQRGSAIAGFVTRLGALAAAYSKNPTRLACMTVMLLEKIRLQGSTGGGSSSGATALSAAAPVAATRMSFPGATDYSSLPFWSSQNSLAPGIPPGRNDPPGAWALGMPEEFLFQTYITTELSLWATSLNVCDSVGLPVPGNSSDFIANFPQYAQNDVFSTAAVLDKVACHAVLCQVTYLTKLRALFQKSSSEQGILSILRNSTTTSSSQTPWGNSMDETALLDMSLLQALLVNGFNGLFDATKAEDLLGILLRHKSITKADVEKRVVELTCLLHKQAQATTTTQVIHRHVAHVVEMTATVGPR